MSLVPKHARIHHKTAQELRDLARNHRADARKWRSRAEGLERVARMHEAKAARLEARE